MQMHSGISSTIWPSGILWNESVVINFICYIAWVSELRFADNIFNQVTDREGATLLKIKSEMS